MNRAAIIAAAAGLVLVAVLVYVSSDGGGVPSEQAAPVPSPDEDPSTLAGAVAKARQWTGHDTDTTTARTLVMLGWANRHLTWADVDIKENETTPSLVQRDTDAQIGKRMCVQGKVVVLHLVKTEAARSAAGVLEATDGYPFVFQAARNIGSVEQDSVARFCGVVSGLNREPSDLGPAGAVVLVGMFEADRASPAQQ